MLKETLQLHEKIEKEVPFENTTSTLFVGELLTIQTFFRKNNVPYYFKQTFTKNQIEDIIFDENLVTLFIAKLKEFYEIAETIELNHSELVNQSIINN